MGGGPNELGRGTTSGQVNKAVKGSSPEVGGHTENRIVKVIATKVW